jgi:hypothetical protein
VKLARESHKDNSIIGVSPPLCMTYSHVIRNLTGAPCTVDLR